MGKLGPRRRRFLAFAGLLLTLSGCLWLRYERMATTHGELLAGYAADARDVAAAGLTPDDRYLRSLEYPLLRARDFTARARGALAPRASLDRLDALVAAYGELYELMLPLRKAPADEKTAARLVTLAEIVAREQALLLEALAGE
jgi:hypothetical protein